MTSEPETGQVRSSAGAPGTRRSSISRPKKLLLGLVTCVFFFAVIELALLIAGVKPLASDVDPLDGFSNQFPLFVSSAAKPELQTTAANRLSYFNRQSFPSNKSDSDFRIFCLGGSTTYGRPYDDQTSFAGFLRIALPQMDTSRNWQVVNAGGISYGSARVEVIVRELVQHKPDLFVIYTGHNEFLEEQTLSGVARTPQSVRSLGAWASHVRTFSLVHRLVHGQHRPGQNNDQQNRNNGHEVESHEVNALLDRSIGPSAYHRDDEKQQCVTDQFRTNLEQIVTLATTAGAQVVLITPAANLRNCRPFKSEYRSDLQGSELQLHSAHVNAANKALQAGDHQPALNQVLAALAIDDRHAATHFLHGTILLANDDPTGARDAFGKAREEDICPLRASQKIVSIVQDVARQHELPLIDFAQDIDDMSDRKIPGNDWFLDHVHPTIEGHQYLARRLCEELSSLKFASPVPEWNEDTFNAAAERVKQNIDPQKHAIALRNLAKVLGWAGKTEEADQLAIKAAKLLGDDSESQSMAGFAALRTGNIENAKIHFESALALDPKNIRAVNGMGNVFSNIGNHQKAFECFSAAVKLDQQHVPSWFNMGNAAKELQQFDIAAAAYTTALRLTPEQPDAHKNLGLTRLAQGDLPATIKEFEAALNLDSNSPERHCDLGFVLIEADQLTRAQTAFQAASDINPNCIPAMIGQALLYEAQGNPGKASEVLRHALMVEPGNANVTNLLKRMQK